MAILINQTGEKTEVRINPKDVLGSLQRFVDGHIQVVYLENGKSLVFNENGIMLRLPINFEASRMFFQFEACQIWGNMEVVLTSEYDRLMEETIIRGNAVILNPKETDLMRFGHKETETKNQVIITVILVLLMIVLVSL